ncbi:MAG: hypothetical protein ACRDOB_04740, partial [Streptosporangiaceae bacterium]
LSIVTALSGRPAPPKKVNRSIVPGVVLLVISALLLWYTGSLNDGGGGALELLGGLVALIVAVILLAGPCLALMARFAGHTPIAARLALRDLGRYRARSGSALAAISLGVLIAALVCVLAAGRYGNVLDYAGPNLASNQVIVYTANGPGGGPGGPNGGGSSGATPSMKVQTATADGIAAALGSHDVIALESTSASLQHAAPGRTWSGPVYVGTPQLLAAFGIKASQVNPDAQVLSMRPGLAGLSKMQLVYGDNGGQGPGGGGNGPGGPNQDSWPCPAGQCVANPVIEQESALPSGTSAPNTVITEHAVTQLHLGTSISGWLILAPHNPTAAQITNARLAAAAQDMSIETKSSTPAASEILDWATVFGIALALGILAMSVGLIRSETARDLRTLTATGADGWTRRTITAVTAGALGLIGALLGTVAAYVGAIAYSFSNQLDGLGSLKNIPLMYLVIIVIGLPLFATVAGWLLAGREPAVIARQPME